MKKRRKRTVRIKEGTCHPSKKDYIWRELLSRKRETSPRSKNPEGGIPAWKASSLFLGGDSGGGRCHGQPKGGLSRSLEKGDRMLNYINPDSRFKKEKNYQQQGRIQKNSTYVRGTNTLRIMKEEKSGPSLLWVEAMLKRGKSLLLKEVGGDPPSEQKRP